MTAKPRPHVIDMEPHRAEKTRSEADPASGSRFEKLVIAHKSEDAGSMRPVWVVPNAMWLCALYGVLAMSAGGIAVYLPEAPWGSNGGGLANLFRCIAFILATWAACIFLLYVCLGAPVKGAFWTAHVQNRLARYSIEALEIGVIAFAVVCAIGLPVSGLVLSAPDVRQDAPVRPIPAALRRSRPAIVAAAPAPSRPEVAPVPAIVRPYQSPYLKFFRHRAERIRRSKRRR